MNLPDETDQDTVADNVPGSVTAQVDVGGDDAAAVAAHNLHGDARRALQAAADVVPVPGQAKRNLGVDS